MSDPVSLLDAGLCRSPGGCAPVLPVIFTVFGDLANESWDQLRDVLPVGSGYELARVLLGQGWQNTSIFRKNTSIYYL